MPKRPTFPARSSFYSYLGALLIASVLVTSCRSDALGPALEFTDLLVGDLQIAPTELILDDGQSGWFSLHLRKKDGTLMTSVPGKAEWTSSAPGIASVSSTGAITAKQPGSTLITARFGDQIVQAPVVVFPTPSDLRPLFDGEMTGRVGASLPGVGVRVVDRGGLPVPGVTISFAVEMGGGSVFPRTVVTGPDGSAHAVWRLGPQAGDNALVASAQGVETVLLRARAESGGEEDRLELLGGDNQQGVVDEALPQQLTVRVVDEQGNAVPNAAVEWIFESGTAESGGSGSAGGTVTSVADAQGVATMRWRLGAEAGSQRTTVRPLDGHVETWFLASAQAAKSKIVVVTPSSATIGTGQQTTLSAAAVDKFGNPVNSGAIRWSSSDESVASVDASGGVRGVGVGTAQIVAKSGNVTGSAQITVQSVGPASLSIFGGNGQSGPVGSQLPQEFEVKVLDGSGNPLPNVDVAWSVVSGGGSLSAASSKTGGAGRARVSYTLGGTAGVNQVRAIVGSLAPVTFTSTAQAAGVASVQVTPTGATVNAGQTLQMVATALDASGNPVPGKSFSWTTSDASVATVGGTGLVTGVAAGTATISAMTDGITGSATFDVTRDVSSVVITTPPQTLNAIGDTAQYRAQALDASGSPIGGVTFTWSSQDATVATVDALGRVVSRGVGTAIIEARASGKSDGETVNSRQIVAQLDLSPHNPTVDEGSSLQMQANAADSNGVTVPSVTVTWSSSNTGVATVSSGGMVQGVTAGSAQISANTGGAGSSGEGSGGGVTGSETVSVQSGSAPPPPPPPPPPPSGSPELPRDYVNTSYVPPTGNTIRVNQGDDLQAAIDQAQRGDIILLQAGATFMGEFDLRAKSGSGWITITTDTNLPGGRMTPGAAASANLARVVSQQGWEPALRTDPGASHYRIMGIEFTFDDRQLPYGSGGIVRLGSGQQSAANMPSYIILDRLWIHGYPHQLTKRCVELNTAWSAVVDSYLDNCHSSTQDSQAIMTWNGSGPFKIVNNYLAGAGENVMFGGGDPSIANLVPSDIEIRGNHFHKPNSWKNSSTTTVKNLFELKNARRVLVEGNVFEGNWTDGQTGYAFNLKSSNQSGSCTWCVTEHVTIRYNVIRNSENGISLLAKSSNPAIPMNNVLFEHNVFYDLGADSDFGGQGIGFKISGGPANLMIRHNTMITKRQIASIGGSAMSGFQFVNNVTPRGQYGIKGNGEVEGTNTLNVYAPSAAFTGNVLIGANSSLYPTGNYFPGTMGGVGFVNAGADDYRLSSSSPYKGLVGGQDPGADVNAVNQMTAGVR